MKRTLIRFRYPLLLLSILVCWWFWPNERVIPSVVAQLKEGISLEEMEEILGPHLSMDRYWVGYDYWETKENNEGKYWVGHYEFNAKSGGRASIKTVGESLPLINWYDKNSCAFVWMGSQVCVIARFEDKESQKRLISFHIAPVVRSGGSAWDWVQQEYQKWSNAISPVPPGYPLAGSPPPPPPPPLPKRLKN
jgi:hypothetical protein